MKKLYHSLFLNNRLFYILAAIAVLFVVGFFVPIFFHISKVLLFILFLLIVVDTFLIFHKKNGITVERVLPERLSNGDANKIMLHIRSRYSFLSHLSLIEELPYQFQK